MWIFGKKYPRQKGPDHVTTCRMMQSLCILLSVEKLWESFTHRCNLTFDLKELLWLQ